MRKTPLLLTLLVLCVPFVVALTQLIGVTDKLTNPVLVWVHGHVPLAIFVLAGLLFLLALLKEVVGWIGFRRGCIRKALDQFLTENCSGEAKKHRLTVFKRGRGIFVVLIGTLRLVRLGRGVRNKWVALWGIKWFHQYLYVYARATDARSQVSSAAFRISDTPDECEGMAGQVWEQGFCIADDLPRVTRQQLAAVRDLSTLTKDDPVRIFAERTYTRSIAQLHAVTHPARHFIGSHIRVDGRMWGVLLLDSEADRRPFPDPGKKKQGGQFGTDFKRCAAMLSHFLS